LGRHGRQSQGPKTALTLGPKSAPRGRVPSFLRDAPMDFEGTFACTFVPRGMPPKDAEGTRPRSRPGSPPGPPTPIGRSTTNPLRCRFVPASIPDQSTIDPQSIAQNTPTFIPHCPSTRHMIPVDPASIPYRSPSNHPSIPNHTYKKGFPHEYPIPP
jgi:hypothetical protein